MINIHKQIICGNCDKTEGEIWTFRLKYKKIHVCWDCLNELSDTANKAILNELKEREKKKEDEIMKKVEHYICDFCGAEYDNKTKCQECEKRHKNPVSIEGQQYGKPRLNDWLGYPSILRVKMDDGEIIEYKRHTR